MTARAFIKRLYTEVVKDAVSDSAAQLSYYFLFSLFPFLFFLVTLTAYLPLQGAVEGMMDRLQYMMPTDALSVIRGHLSSLLNKPRPRLLTVGLLTTLWTASRGVDALRKALNLAYDVRESRPFWRTQLTALLMTIAGTLLVVVAFSMIVLGGKLGFWIADKVNVGQQFMLVWSWMRWPITAAIIMLVAALSYFLLPDVKQQFKYITPGSVTSTVLWLTASFGFTRYVEEFGKYNVTYGSIGGVIVLMLWLYISGLIFIFGGEINAIIEHESAGGKVPGAKAPGEAPAPPEERPSFVPPGAVKTKKAWTLARLRFWRRGDKGPRASV